MLNIAAGYSEDSDYTSDLNYPVGHNANSSASQYRNLQTPQRSLETSRENSYDKEDRMYNTQYDTTTTVGLSLNNKPNACDMVNQICPLYLIKKKKMWFYLDAAELA